jgi:DNA (cytosine-5)-methyltransferase 1
MAKKKSYLTVTDQFCGAGGSSQGVRRYVQRTGLGSGMEVKLAMNHWKLALETHATNFPDTDHVATDIQACNPKDYPSTTILITSPECTNHSVAKGKKQVKAQMDAFDQGTHDAAAERSRATMWDVVRFAEYHKYKIIITENVVDANAWMLIDVWLGAMVVLGYEYKRVFYNSMFAWPTPQSRDRVYFVFWRKGQPRPNLDIRPWAPCPTCGPVEAIQRFKPKASVKAKFGTQYTYVCPTCAKDVMPFYYAAINAIDWNVPAVRIGDRKTPLKERTMQRIQYGLDKYGNRPLSISMLDGQPRTNLQSRVKDATGSPLQTMHSANSAAIASPYLVDTKYSHAGAKRAKAAVDPLRAQTGQESTGVVMPILVGTEYDDAKRAKGVDAPMPAQTGRATLGVAMPFTMDGSFTKAGGEYMNGADEAMGTQTTTQSKSVVIPPALMVDTNYFTNHNKPVDQPLPAQTSANKMGVAFLAKLRGTGDDQMNSASSGVDEPVGTINSGGVHHALITGKTMGFLSAYYGGSNVCDPLDGTMSTMSTRERHSLVTGGKDLKIEDLYFRMLKHHEVQAGMAFDSDYVVLGNGREKIKQLGNAVTPPVMEILVERCVESLM